MRRAVHLAFVAGLSLSCGGKELKGLEVTVDLNGRTPKIIRVLVSADPGGFAMPGGSGTPGVMIENETDADGRPAVALQFDSADFAFGGKFSFLLDTRNAVPLTMTASALGFTDDKLNSGAGPVSASLPAGGHAPLVLTLGTKMGDVSPVTRTTDLKADLANLTIKGGKEMSQLRALASCNVDGQGGADDIVIGFPASPDSRMLGAVGAVHVVLGGNNQADVDLETVGGGQEFHFYGRDPGDQLGYAIACADVNGDQLDDIVVGAPGANSGAGRVYVVFGRTSITTMTINLANNTGQGIAVLDSSVPGGRFGEAVFATPALADIRPGELVLAAPGAQLVHVLRPPAQPTIGIQSGDVSQIVHPTISGATARAVIAGRLTGRRDMVGALDVAIGDSQLHPGNDRNMQGVVYIFAAVNPTVATAFAVGAPPPLGASMTLGGGDNSFFGDALLALDSGSGQDLLVGAPGEANGSGKVHIYKNDAMFFEFDRRALDDDDGVLIGPEANGRFGAALGLSVSGARIGGTERLIVGAPGTSRGMRTGAGAAYVFKTNSNRTFPLVDQIYGAAGMDRLGAAVAGGQVDGIDQTGDLIVAAPDAAGSGGASQAGVVYVRYGR